MVTAGAGLVITTTAAPAEQPNELVPPTEYEVGACGFTMTLAPVRLPGVQVYVSAPLALRFTGSPWHTMVAEAAALMVGIGSALTITVAEPAQVPSLTASEYTVDVVGLIAREPLVLLKPLGYQV